MCCSLYFFIILKHEFNILFLSIQYYFNKKNVIFVYHSIKILSPINSKSIFLAQIPIFVILLYIFERVTRLVYCVGIFTSFWIFLNSLCFASASNLKITFSEVAMWHPISLILYENYIDQVLTYNFTNYSLIIF